MSSSQACRARGAEGGGPGAQDEGGGGNLGDGGEGDRGGKCDYIDSSARMFAHGSLEQRVALGVFPWAYTDRMTESPAPYAVFPRSCSRRLRAAIATGLVRVAVRCSALPCIAVRCSALQCVAVRCSAF